MEGEYFDLSVEECLNALVSLIGVANEGNTIRVVLGERLEAANALKRQMWAEAPGSCGVQKTKHFRFLECKEFQIFLLKRYDVCNKEEGGCMSTALGKKPLSREFHCNDRVSCKPDWSNKDDFFL